MSGAGREKGDGSDDEFLYEIKDRMGKIRSYSISEKELLYLWRQAVKDGKEPMMLIEFPGLTAEVRVAKK